MKQLSSVVVFALASLAASSVEADSKWMEGKVTYKFAGIDTAFTDPAEACKAGVALLAKSGNKKTFVSVKEGTSSTMMTCLLKESDGKSFEQSNILTKVLQCPETTSAKSTNNSGNFADVKCKCDDKNGCPAPGKPAMKPDAKPALTGKWMDGVVTYKIGGVDKVFDAPADACKAGVAQLAKSGNKKTFSSVKEGTSSTMMTCLLKESDGKDFEQLNVVSKILQCPDGTAAKSTNNSGEFADIKCKCDDKKGCPAPGAPTVKVPDVKPALTGNWMDGVPAYKIGGVDKVFDAPAEACKAGVAELAKSGNKKTYSSVKEGTSSTTMTCVLKESDGKVFDQLNVVTKLLKCPADTVAKSTNNSGEFADIKCKCDDKKGCPKN
ncbi:MAG: hypothetical protein JNL79_16840 [Myxococcales bacterium]|nr:hypothetical protein [Myxococcales bacterium]